MVDRLEGKDGLHWVTRAGMQRHLWILLSMSVLKVVLLDVTEDFDTQGGDIDVYLCPESFLQSCSE